jgi:hypothetical protein
MDSASSIISTLAVMVETRDGHSEGHCHRMANYPDGLKGDQVPLLAQIVGICDAFDAITSKRAYHEQQPAAIAITVLQRQVELGWRRPDLIALFTEPVQQGRLDELPLGAPALTTSTPFRLAPAASAELLRTQKADTETLERRRRRSSPPHLRAQGQPDRALRWGKEIAARRRRPIHNSVPLFQSGQMDLTPATMPPTMPPTTPPIGFQPLEYSPPRAPPATPSRMFRMGCRAAFAKPRAPRLACSDGATV